MKKTMILTAMIVLAVGLMAFAQPGPQGKGNCDFGPGHNKMCDRPGGGPGRMMDEGAPGIKRILGLSDEISLTDQQKERLEKMMVDFQLVKVDNKAKMEKAHIQLRSLMRNDKAPEMEIMNAIDEVSRLESEMKKMHYRHQKEAKSVLTQEQIDKLKDIKDESFQQFKQNQDDASGMRRGPGFNRFDG